jgi:hypothetical protein
MANQYSFFDTGQLGDKIHPFFCSVKAHVHGLQMCWTDPKVVRLYEAKSKPCRATNVSMLIGDG